jgi:hypothetical protein
VLDRRERALPLVRIGQVGVQQGQVELDVHRLLEQVPGQVQPRLRGVDVPVQVEHQVVGDDRVAGGEERDQPVHQVPLAVAEPGQVGQVGGQVHLLHRPGVGDGGAELGVEVGVPHGPQGQVHAGVEQQPIHWHASQVSGFSSEQASPTVVGRMRVAGRERR